VVNQHASIKLNDQAQLSLRLFRALFILSITHEDDYTRSLKSFGSYEPDYIVEFDASLYGSGCVLYKRTSESREIRLGSSSISLESYEFGENSSFQNVAEFIAAICGLAILSYWCPKGSCIWFQGDSVSALTWLETGKFGSIPVSKAPHLHLMS